MTCVIGYLDKKNNTAYLGGDSLGSNGYSKILCNQRKVFHSKDTKNLIIGLSGSFNFQALEYEKLLDETALPKNEITKEYLITKFVPNLKTIVNKYNANSTKDNLNSMKGSLLFGYKDKLFNIQCDYSLLESTNGFDAIGSGAEVAMGSLLTSCDMDISIINKITKALEAAEKHAVGVQRPFYIINTSTDDVVVID